MSFYISDPVQADATTIKQRGVDYLTAYAPPGFQLQPGDPIDLILEWNAQEAAEQADVANGLLDDAFRYIGSLFNVPPIDATPATGLATFTVQDTAGYTIPGGTTILGLNDATGTLQAFDLVADLVIAPGSSTGSGTVQAETAGTVANGLSGTAQLVQAPTFVVSATVATTGNAIDAELTSTFLDRLAETFTIITPRPILAKDFSILVRSVAGVYRAAGVDNLKPGPPYDTAAEATGVEKNITVAVADINGQPVGSTVRATAKTFLQSYLTQNSVVWVVDPQYATIDVGAPGVYAWPGWDPTAVQASVIAALQAALSPATFGTDPSGSAARWANDPWVRADLIANTIRQVAGVRYLSPQPVFGIAGASSLATPSAPSPTNAGTGGTIAAGTYGVKVTLVSAMGETLASAAGTTTTSGATSTITIPSPGAVSGAIGWYAYVTQPGGSTYTLQQPAGSPTAIGTGLTLIAPPTSTGAVPPVSNTAEVLASTDVQLGAGSAIPALPVAGRMNVIVHATA